MGEESSKKLKSLAAQVGACLDQGQHEDAFLLLEELKQLSPDPKDFSELFAITEVCYAATKTSCSCPETQGKKPHDWYLILKVEDNAKQDVIRKRYRQLALLLHPDKNKHPKAETAFKYVSEAYACLSDKRKRTIYNMERSKGLCKRCSQTVQKAMSPDKEKFGQNHLKTTKCFVEKAYGINTDEEKLQAFRERARARVDLAARARQERWARYKELSQEIGNVFQSNRDERRELPIFQGSNFQYPNYPHWRVSDVKGRSNLPMYKDTRERAFCNHFKSDSASCASNSNRENMQRSLYEEASGRKSPLSEIKRSKFCKNLKETLKAHHMFGREHTKAPRNLDSLLQKLQAEGGNNSSGTSAFRDTRKYKVEDGKNSVNVKNWYYRRSLEGLDAEDESEESFDGIENRSFLLDINKILYRDLLRKRLQEECNMKPIWKHSSLIPDISSKISKAFNTTTSGAELQKSEDLLKTLEILRQEAKDVSATLDKLRKSVGSEEDHAVRSFLCNKFPVASGS